MIRGRTVLAAAVGMLVCASCFSQTAEEILGRATLFGEARWLSVKIGMELKGPTGVRQRGLEVFVAREQGATRFLAHLVAPAFLSQMKFLSHRGADGTTSSWLRTSQGVRKLTRANAAERIFDSDFTVEDFTDIDLADFAAEVLPDIAIDQVPCHAVRLTPKAAAQYRRKVVYVAIDGGMLRGTDFTDAQGGLVRQYRLLETRLADGATFPSVSVMRNVPAQTETRLTVETIDATTPLPDKTFNKGNL